MASICSGAVASLCPSSLVPLHPATRHPCDGCTYAFSLVDALRAGRPTPRATYAHRGAPSHRPRPISIAIVFGLPVPVRGGSCATAAPLDSVGSVSRVTSISSSSGPDPSATAAPATPPPADAAPANPGYPSPSAARPASPKTPSSASSKSSKSEKSCFRREKLRLNQESSAAISGKRYR